MDRQRFQAVIVEAIESLPDAFRDGLRNITVVIEDRPIRRRLFGLYEGVPLPQRDHGSVHLPDKITLYQANIEAACTTEAEMVEEIHKTLFHEIGHYFGLTEEQLASIGY